MPTFMHIARGTTVDGVALGIDGVDQFSTITSGAESRTVSEQRLKWGYFQYLIIFFHLLMLI